MLVALWSPKGGSGTSVLAAASALVLARRADGARLADLDGDLPAIFGLAADPPTGVADWIAAGPDAPVDALARLALPAAPGVVLLPRGMGDRALAAVPEAEAGAALAVALRDGPVPTLIDAGRASTPAARAVIEVADVSVAVVRGCYLALRRGVHSPLLARTTGIVLVEESGRSLGAPEVADVLDRPVLARIPVRPAIARSIDAGVLASRLPESLARPVARFLASIDLLTDRRGEAV